MPQRNAPTEDIMSSFEVKAGKINAERYRVNDKSTSPGRETAFLAFHRAYPGRYCRPSRSALCQADEGVIPVGSYGYISGPG